MNKLIGSMMMIALMGITGVQHVQGETAKWEFDRDHSRVYFEIDHTFAKVRGQFDEFSGIFQFDPENIEASKIEIDIKTESINTNIAKRDNHLKTEDFFSAEKYPMITFRSRHISREEGNRYMVEGDLTIKDVTKRVILPMNYLGMKENPLKEGQIVAGYESRFTIDRLEYHVGSGKFYQMGVVGKDVDVIVSLEMLRDK